MPKKHKKNLPHQPKTFLESLNDKLSTVYKNSYLRPQYNSFMSGPEWRNVEIAEEFAQFLKEGRSIFQYPYFSQVWDMWRCFFQSYKISRKYDDDKALATSEYMVMDVFVAFFTTFELLPKGILSLFLGRFLKKENSTEVQEALAAYFEQYAKNLQTTAFYDHDYAFHRQQIIEAYKAAQHKTWGDWFGCKLISAELWARYWVSKPLHAWFHTEENVVTPKTDILVEMETGGASENAAAIFREKMAHIPDVSLVKQADGKDCMYLEAEETHAHVLARLRVSRYAPFLKQMEDLTQADIAIKKIAGQDHVQVKCEIDVPLEKLAACEEALKHTPNAQFIYSYGDRIHPNRKICLFDVPVSELQNTVGAFKSQDVKVSFIHNF